MTDTAAAAEIARLSDAMGRIYQDALTLWVKHVGNDIPPLSDAAELILSIRETTRDALTPDEAPI